MNVSEKFRYVLFAAETKILYSSEKSETSSTNTIHLDLIVWYSVNIKDKVFPEYTLTFTKIKITDYVTDYLANTDKIFVKLDVLKLKCRHINPTYLLSKLLIICYF